MGKTIQSIPEARLLLSSLRSVGYSEEAAIADIIDNCISAHANNIDIYFDWDAKRLLIVDDGDGMNDAEMLEFCELGIAMGNGAQEAKNVSDYITDSVNNFGIIKALKHYKYLD